MNNRKKPLNPWNKAQQSKQAKPINLQNPPVTSETKFKAVQVKLQEAVKKHAKDYESSSDEEELECDNVISSVLQTYTQTGGEGGDLGRTSTFLKESFLSGAATCLICISRIKRDHAIWSCSECFCFFHLECIQRWSKDSIVQQKQALDSRVLLVQQLNITWCCPKCRHEYKIGDIPEKYFCFCKKTVDPIFQPFLVPHSCGEICKKDLKPACGHKCLLLCHPGPCPPCSVTVNVPCYCGSESPTTQRCSNKEWSCGSRCGKLLTCGKHTCSEPCHAGDCKPCTKKSLQKCLCKSEQKLRDCASPLWQCEKICNHLLDCGNHKCLKLCHEIGKCLQCDLTKPRTCPCGKAKYQLPCTEETPTCQDTCDKVLDCGRHTCNQRCHKDKCGACLETVTKSCRCGLHTKEIQCCKPYLCETKCKRMKDCNRHPCNRKCCDGHCTACEKPCGRTLSCGNHKCNSICHRGLCYPCNQTETISCRCGTTKIIVPCGRKQKIKPPKCNELCKLPPDCHHPQRDQHRCHFGECPPCKQVCNKTRSACQHPCIAPCHSSVMVKIEGEKPSMPWEQSKPQLVKKKLSCSNCVIPVAVTCLGGHETADWPCHMAKSSSCMRPCGRLLACGNHECSLPCHPTELSDDEDKVSVNCETCENSCTKPRPDGCKHECLEPCHLGDCPPCKSMSRIRCHCGLIQLYVSCTDWQDESKREQLQSCGNQCPKNYECSHRCRVNCHSGPCPNPEQCRKKVKVSCTCKRIKKDFTCDMVRNNSAKVDCDEGCQIKKDEEKKLQDALNEQKRLQEEIRNKRELEKYQKMFEGKKKSKERRMQEDDKEKLGLFKKHYHFILGVSFVLFAFGIYLIYM